MSNKKYTNKDKVDNKEEKEKKKRNRLAIFFSIFGSAAIVGAIVGSYFIFKSCYRPKEEDKYNITVIQPTTVTGWTVTANGNTGTFKAKIGDTISVLVAQTKTFNFFSSNELTYKIKVNDGSTDWFFDLTYDEIKNQFTGEFIMNFKHDITISIIQADSKDFYIYHVDADQKVWINKDNSLYKQPEEASEKITLVNIDDETEKLEYSRSEFDLELHVGSNISKIDGYFLNDCSSFDSLIIFDSDSKLLSIGDSFLIRCKKFNKPLNLPKSLLLIYNNFLYECDKFNQPLDLHNVQYLWYETSKGEEGTFLKDCISFNSSINIDSVTEIPGNFLVGCTSFDQNITIPASVTQIYSNFMSMCDNMTHTVTFNCPLSAFNFSDSQALATLNSSAPCYVQGIKIAGENKSSIVSSYQEETGPNWYRKLVEA